ncbi:hypothetical protein [Actinomadura violacea]|uniref:Uncharacterized protein n=1 Tax=Actinomadura violacea TaxID=2819934 RepID=A0ABS3RXG6_9ACTN|nr:hypothetical protein [Actinomadura violacea]MBO2461456.1 hypothetical protein [Actinomadura violacea]
MTTISMPLSPGPFGPAMLGTVRLTPMLSEPVHELICQDCPWALSIGPRPVAVLVAASHSRKVHDTAVCGDLDLPSEAAPAAKTGSTATRP